METVGNYLKCEREAKNMSLRDASRLTCIAEYYLGYIEKDEFDKLPQGPYIKGYITSYSEMIGTDVNKVLDLYESLSMPSGRTESFRVEESLPKDDPAAPPFKSGIKVFDTPPPEASATATHHAASEVPAPVASSFKTNAIAAWRKCAIGAERGAGYVASSLSLGKGWLDRVKFRASAASSSLKVNTIAVWRKCAAGSERGARCIASSLSISKGWRDRAKFRASVASSSLKANAIAAWRKCGVGAERGAGYVRSSLSLGKGWFDAAAARIKSRRWLRLWRPVLLALMGACILILAAFGFYHLFIYEKPSLTSPSLASPSLASKDQQFPQKPLKASSFATETENTPANLKTAPIAPDTKQPEEIAAKAVSDTDRRRATDERSSTASASRTNSSDRAAVEESPPTPIRAASTPGIDVLKASVCLGIKNRMPSGVDNVFSHLNERIYVWTQIQATVVPNQIRHIYYFNDQAVSDVTLTVGSAHWRTWSYISNSGNRHRGEWHVDITSVDGKVLRRLYFTVE